MQGGARAALAGVAAAALLLLAAGLASGGAAHHRASDAGAKEMMPPAPRAALRLAADAPAAGLLGLDGKGKKKKVKPYTSPPGLFIQVRAEQRAYTPLALLSATAASAAELSSQSAGAAPHAPTHTRVHPQERASKGLPGPGQHFSFGALKPWDEVLDLLNEREGGFTRCVAMPKCMQQSDTAACSLSKAQTCASTCCSTTCSLITRVSFIVGAHPPRAEGLEEAFSALRGPHLGRRGAGLLELGRASARVRAGLDSGGA